jgi:predicted PurR-regulated permease PerM
MKPYKIENSYRLVILAVLILLSLWLLFQIRQLLVILFISLIFMSALNPSIKKLTEHRIPRTLAISGLYFLIILLLGFAIEVIIPPLFEQSDFLVTRLPYYLKMLKPYNINSDIIIGQISNLGYLPANIIKLVINIFGNIVGILLTATFTFYLSNERENLKRYLAFILSPAKTEKAENIISKIEYKLGGWVRAEITLMIIIGLLAYLSLSILRVEYAVPLAILAGLMEVVPNYGPIISAIPAVAIAMLISPVTGFAVIGLYLLIHQLENSIIVPQVMAKEVGVNPLITIIFLSIGFKLGGIAGAVLAIPIFLVMEILLKEIRSIHTFNKTFNQ